MRFYLFGGTFCPSCTNFTLKKKTVQDNKTEPISSDELAMKLSSQLCDFLAPGRFKLTQWFSNSHKVSSLYQLQEELYKLIF